MSDKVKPCPFCGGRPDLSFEHSSEHPDWWKVTCVECGNRTASNTTSKATAIYNWNTRPALDQPQNDAEAACDPAADDRWNEGLDFAMMQLCAVIGVDPHDVTWDAATEELEGDVRAVIGNILRAKMGEDWNPRTAPPSPELERMRKAMEIVRNMIDGKMIANAVTDIRTMKPLKDLVNESLRAGDYASEQPPELERMREALDTEAIHQTIYKHTYMALKGRVSEQFLEDIFWCAAEDDAEEIALRAGDNHASDGRESEINEAPLCKKCGHHATSERVLACGSSCQMRPSDPTPAQERREEIARCLTCGRSDAEYNSNEWTCIDPWHTDDHLRALALPPAPKGEPSQEWEPIDTAPRNLVVMLAWSPDDWTVGQGFYRGDRWVACGCFFNPTLPHPRIEMREMYPEPTHWQHIPGPPAGER